MSNYDKMLDKARILFLTYDQSRIIEKWRLKADEGFIYFSYLGKKYKLDRKTGNVEHLSINGTLAMYDILCNENDNFYCSGNYCSIDALRSKLSVSGPGSELNSNDAELILNKESVVSEIVKSHGGIMLDKGDLSFSLPITLGIDIRIVVWRADEDFSANLQFFFDDKILDFFRFETLFYIMNDILEIFVD